MSAPIQSDYIATAATVEQVQTLIKGDHLHGFGFPRIAVVGRSNVGKSSLINSMVGRRKLAFVSATPGKTRSIQFFLWKELKIILADLPGYGFAKVDREERERWDRLMAAYLKIDPGLLQVWLLWDSRHGPTASDEEALDFFLSTGVSFEIQVVMTKFDELKTQSERSKRKRDVEAYLNKRALPPPIWVSSKARTGMQELLKKAQALPPLRPPGEEGNLGDEGLSE